MTRKMPGRQTQQFLEGEKKRKQLIELIYTQRGSVRDALRIAGVKTNTYERWRSRYPEFKQRFDSAKQAGLREFGGDYEAARARNEEPRGFADYRLHWFGHRSPWLHLAMIDAYESTPPGNITMILVPPESGKTSLFEDYACHKLGDDPEYRFTVGSERINLSADILNRVRGRMEPEGPFPAWVERFGPFVPQDATGRKTRQPWGEKAFSVFRKAAHDERDPSMKALGFKSAVAGTRTDHLHCDDLQSVKSLNETEKMLRAFRQDWLTRPGEKGKTSINGTRVGEGDIYEALEEDLPAEILRVVRYPAIITRHDPDTNELVEEPLIPFDPDTGFGWTTEMLDRMRIKVGEDAWANNYMQIPRAKAQLTFTPELIDGCLNPLRSIEHSCSKGAILYFSLDPAIGSANGYCAGEITADRLAVLDIFEQTGLMRNEDIMDHLDRLIGRYVSQGGYATELIIEAKNFQAGLARDQRLLDMCERYGLTPREHLTDVNKYDESLGVSSMTYSFRRHEIDLPYAADDLTRERIDKLRHQLLAWRPLARGNRLRQDLVMALWFMWIFWRERRGEDFTKPGSPIVRQGMPYTPTRAGLLVPGR